MKIFQVAFFLIITTSMISPSFCYNQSDVEAHHTHEQYEHETIDDPIVEEAHSHTHRHGPGEPEHTHEHSHNVPTGNNFDLKVVSLSQEFVLAPNAFQVISYPIDATLIPQNISRSIFRPPIS